MVEFWEIKCFTINEFDTGFKVWYCGKSVAVVDDVESVS